MFFLPRFLRPVGNRISLKSHKFDSHQFAPFKISFFQSGTSALAAAILASIKVKGYQAEQAEVILPAYGCPDIISATILAGAKPVLVDFEENLPWMSLQQLKKKISDNTVAVIAINFLGIPERMTELKQILQPLKITLIEDSAQGFPIQDANRYWQGDINIVSFGRGKPVNLLGGGAVFCMQEDLNQALPKFTVEQESLSASMKYQLKIFIYNLTINPILYALLVRLPGLKIGQTLFKPPQNIEAISKSNLDRLSTNLELYRQQNGIAQHINHGLISLHQHQLTDLTTTTDFDLNKPLLRYPLLIKSTKLRDQFYQENKKFGLSLMYPVALNKIKGLEQIVDAETCYPNAENFASRLITLPVHNDVTDNDIEILKQSLFRNR